MKEQLFDPPKNIEAEEAVLGSILIDPYVLDAIEPLNLKHFDFYIERNQWVYQACIELHQDGSPIDLLSLATQLKNNGKLEEIGGEPRLTELMNVTPTSTHGYHYAQLVVDKANRRRQSNALSQIARYTLDPANKDYIVQSERVWDNRLNGRGAITRPDTWEIYDLGKAYEPRPPLTWVVEGLFSLPSLSIVYGAPGTMKSILLADMLACVSVGLPWLEPWPNEPATVQRKTEGLPVLWIDFDNGPRRTHERFEAVGRARNIGEGAPLYYTSMPDPWLDASDPGQMEMLARRVKKLKARVIVIDNLGIISGATEENSADMANVMAALRKLAESCHAAVIVIHHQSKNKGATRVGDTLRGHSSIESALDLALLVNRQEGADRVEIKSTKTRDIDVFPFAAQFAYEHKPGTVELATAKFFGVKPEETDDSRTLELTIKACVSTNPGLSKNKLTDIVKKELPEVGILRIKGAIDSAATEQKIEVKSAGTGKKFAYYPVERQLSS